MFAAGWRGGIEGLALPGALGAAGGVAVPAGLGGMEVAALPGGGLAGLGLLLLGRSAAGVLLLVGALGAAVLEEAPVADPLPEGAASAWPLPGAGGAGLTGEGAPLPAGGAADAGCALCCSLTPAAGVVPEAQGSSQLLPESSYSCLVTAT